MLKGLFGLAKQVRSFLEDGICNLYSLNSEFVAFLRKSSRLRNQTSALSSTVRSENRDLTAVWTLHHTGQQRLPSQRKDRQEELTAASAKTWKTARANASELSSLPKRVIALTLFSCLDGDIRNCKNFR